jgi:ABC-type microcin C transport system duplicated ATPase subunit YejF
MSEASLIVSGLTVELPRRSGLAKVVKGIDLTLKAGETLAIVGESGSGKSMTALSLMGLLPRGAVCRAARATYDGQALLDRSAAARKALRGKIAMIFQEPMTSLNPVLTIGRQLHDVFRAHAEGPSAEGRVIHPR